MITAKHKVAIVSVFFAHIACGYSPSLHNLSARELKIRDDEALKHWHFWKEREKDAIPKVLMVQERRRAEEDAHAKGTTVRLFQEERNMLLAKMAETDRRLAKAEEDHARAVQNSQDWKQRSTSEKVHNQLKKYHAELCAIQAAYDAKPWLEKHMHPLAERVTCTH